MTRGASVVWLVALAWSTTVQARAPRPATRTERAKPAHIPGPLAVGRVRVEVRGAKMLVTTDLTIPQARQALSDLDVHVAYGSPGPPVAFDAQVIATPRGYFVAPVDTSGRRLGHEWSARTPVWAAVLVGRPQLGGQLVHLTADALSAAQQRTGRATLRIREVYRLPPMLSDHTREVVLRLASADGKPLPVGLLEFASDVAAPRVEARFCGLDGERAELFVSGGSRGATAAAAPLAERALHDDLCLRFGSDRTP